MTIYLSLLLAFGLLGLVFVGIRSERLKQERLLREAIRTTFKVSVANGNRRRIL